ncbi:MAG TPA: dihydrolipoamide acetyltransferase family protein [bacterium]|nr:dihydrolipoamide acetyltransferase family protein [bacterium]
MPTEIKMPQLGESVHEGTIGRWLKQPGEAVAKYEPLVEVITDKVNVEMPSPSAGLLRAILVAEGETVVVGTAIAVIDEQGGAAVQGAAVPATASVPPAAARSADDGERRAPARPRPEGVKLTPLVRRLAEEHRLSAQELAGLSGTGEGGRITKDDVLRYLDARASAPRPAEAAAPASAGGDQLHRLSPLRRAIAERMTRSKREIPHAYGIIEADVTGIVRHREAHKAAWSAREGVNISITAFIVCAAARALRAFPMVNSTFTADGVLYKQAINLGVGVAVPDGLIVPVIKDADRKPVVAVAKELARLSTRAREGTLTLEEVSGGTFTLTNAGVFGSVMSMPIINHPQAAILATDAIVRRPVVVGEGIAVREMMYLGLAFDHRIFDGAVGMQFLGHIKQQVEGFTPVGDSPEF